MTTIAWVDSTLIASTFSLEELLVPLPDADVERARRYRQSIDQYQFVLGRLLLGWGLGQRERSLDELADLQLEEGGKPFLEGLSFSIAHSSGVVACAFSAPQALGLDVEVPRSLNRQHFRHCFTQVEWMDIESDDSLMTFYHYWTAKEAVLKARGWGLNRLLDIEIRRDGVVHLVGEVDSALSWESLELGAARACLCQTKPYSSTPSTYKIIALSVKDLLPT